MEFTAGVLVTLLIIFVIGGLIGIGLTLNGFAAVVSTIVLIFLGLFFGLMILMGMR